MTISQDQKIDDDRCRAFQRTAELAGRKWNAAIMMGLSLGLVRFSELRHHVDGISDRLLAARLRELETEGLVDRVVVPTTPIQVRYSLTPAGEELMHVLNPLVGWAQRWQPAVATVQANTPLTTVASAGASPGAR